MPFASHGYHAAGSLCHAAELQQQLYRQLALWCEFELAGDPALGHSDHRGEDGHFAAALNADHAARAFRDAVGHATALAKALSTAQAALGPLYHDAKD